MKWVKGNRTIPPIYTIKDLPENIIERNSKLKYFWGDFEEKDERLKQVPENDSDYRPEVEQREKIMIFKFLSSASEAYRKVRAEREKALYRSNVVVLSI